MNRYGQKPVQSDEDRELQAYLESLSKKKPTTSKPSLSARPTLGGNGALQASKSSATTVLPSYTTQAPIIPAYSAYAEPTSARPSTAGHGAARPAQPPAAMAKQAPLQTQPPRQAISAMQGPAAPPYSAPVMPPVSIPYARPIQPAAARSTSNTLIAAIYSYHFAEIHIPAVTHEEEESEDGSSLSFLDDSVATATASATSVSGPPATPLARPFSNVVLHNGESDDDLHEYMRSIEPKVTPSRNDRSEACHYFYFFCSLPYQESETATESRSPSPSASTQSSARSHSLARLPGRVPTKATALRSPVPQISEDSASVTDGTM
jgi:hypothetical protein